jgi:mannose-6-phosphate isomerase-like protein (cupin superfamily)
MTERDILVVPPAGGRAYQLEAMRSRFLADGDETGDRYCVSEWWLDAGRTGPGAHEHEANEELFYVLEGTMTFQAGDDFVDAPQGTFLRIPPASPTTSRTAAPAARASSTSSSPAASSRS